MTKHTLRSMKSRVVLFISVSLIILLVGGCASQQEMRAKQTVDRAGTAYVQAKANPKVAANAPAPLSEAGGLLEEAKQARSYREMERLGYQSEKKSQMAVTISEGKELEKERQALKKEEADLLNQKRVLEATVQAQSAKAEAEQARIRAAKDAATAEKERKEAEAKAREAEQSKLEAEKARKEATAQARETEKARAEAEAKAREAERSRKEAEQTKAEVEQLLKDLAELQGKQTDRGIVLTMGDVLFAFGKADLASGAVRNVDKLAQYLEKHPERNLLIEGHTDSVGSDEFNLALSQKRADAVKEVLTAKGISPDRMMTKGYGKQFPVAGNDTESGRQLNRRVEVVILNEGVKPEAVLR